MDDSRAIRQIAGAMTKDEVFTIARAFYRTHGFNALSYLKPSRIHPGQADVVSFGFPDAWIERYNDGLNLLDPFPALVARAGRPVRLSNLSADKSLSAEQIYFIEQAREHGVTDGYAFPTFGPRQQLAAFGINQVDHEDRVDHADVPILHAIAQAAHLRIDQLEAEELERPRLAPREVLVLHWIAQGKSNEEIAMILGSKRPTIATHIKRIFTKLDVSDRASAAVKGLKFGIINI
ncbi:LuxR family transcriptional regulator [Erythrobacter sp.]|jgi:DNA-binding CsgD family transcriptional regulator|uniref:LuxR family transcriptional regulator n=1 Tax=Erythrobacter sp. TaxID=1042 RepID=UPI001B083BD6|nr:LuxR family transcriptional regulator [Erythrobacter sp.]MBO6526005.1 LuxR family transcriptional regulator [Erythrobacter sp.]MBO6530646.1 LuxR family transcriptional regulator [Erythrobacter sp.]